MCLHNNSSHWTLKNPYSMPLQLTHVQTTICFQFILRYFYNFSRSLPEQVGKAVGVYTHLRIESLHGSVSFRGLMSRV